MVKERLDLDFRGIDGNVIGGQDGWVVVDGAERGDDFRGGLDAAEEGRDEDPVDWEAEIGPELPTLGEGAYPAILHQWRVPRLRSIRRP